MSNAAQVAANQANAQLSTGPKTPAGKHIASQNSFRHGCTGKFMLLSQESYHEFQELKDALFSQHQPANPTEHLLVERLVEHFWLGQRALRLQATAFEEGLSWVDEKKLALYLRYQTTHDRAFHKCLAELQKLQKMRNLKTGEQSNASAKSEARLNSTPDHAEVEQPSGPCIRITPAGMPAGFVSQNQIQPLPNQPAHSSTDNRATPKHRQSAA